jgi:hypothetical protein
MMMDGVDGNSMARSASESTQGGAGRIVRASRHRGRVGVDANELTRADDNGNNRGRCADMPVG